MSTTYLNQSMTIDASKHTLNTSGSKQKFSFPKAQRFPHGRNKSISDIFYDVPSTISDRSTSFGYGHKTFGLHKDQNKPQPVTYTLPSQFQSKKRGVTFGQGRQVFQYQIKKLQLGGPLKESITKKYVPGPGKYQLSHMTIDVPRITIKGRIEDKSQQHLKKVTVTKIQNPGPGAYEYDSLGSSKYYISSRSLYSGSVRITPGKRLQPLNKSVTGSLGPGSYNYKSTQLNPEGKYMLSNFQGSRVRAFSKSKRPDLVNINQLKNPGPGSYNNFSAFS